MFRGYSGCYKPSITQEDIYNSKHFLFLYQRGLQKENLNLKKPLLFLHTGSEYLS